MIQKVFQHENYGVNIYTGEVWNLKTNKKLKASYTWNGYLTVTIDGKRMKVHRVVMMTATQFEGKGKQVNHKDGIKEHNYISNLEWCTPQENINHSEFNHLNPHKQNVTRKDRKLTDEEVIKIKKLLKRGMKSKEICELVPNANYKVIYAIKMGLSYKLIGDNTELTR